MNNVRNQNLPIHFIILTIVLDFQTKRICPIIAQMSSFYTNTVKLNSYDITEFKYMYTQIITPFPLKLPKT